MNYNPKALTIAVDFDGTVVDHEYPKIGKEKLFAFASLKKLQQDGHKLILWTYREGPLLEEAVEYCKQNGIEFFAVNESYPGEKLDENTSRKIHADLFIDDRNVGGFHGWDKIIQQIDKPHHKFTDQGPSKENKTFWDRLRGR